MAIDTKKYGNKYTNLLKDTRPVWQKIGDWLQKKDNFAIVYGVVGVSIALIPQLIYFIDLILITMIGLYVWMMTLPIGLPYRMPLSMNGKCKDPNNEGGSRSGKPEGILFLGNKKESNEEMWFTNSDARTHILYLGTTGSGKTEGLKTIATNALSWASGFVYIDGKADTDLWSSLSSLVRRYGRDDDLFVLNYMTGNSDVRAPSNTMNPFSSGSASYLTNLLVSLMPNAEGDNAMWKERAVSLIGSLMPIMTWKRDHQDVPMSVGTIRKNLELNSIISLSRDEAVPEDLRESLIGYLNTLPGYVDAAFDDDGNEKPPGPDTPMVDTQVVRQQHGYLSMQFTRALQSLADDYGYIFDTQAADVDMVDIVLNRRILVVLIPALEKSSDETANLGKIVAATIKGMMGSTLGATVEGDVGKIIENKPTQSATPFVTIFDEVGYYTAEGMAVMAAQARSLGFCLVYAAQDLPALEKRVKEEARSIAGNCNIKIFGKLEDPTQTKEFYENTVSEAIVAEASQYQTEAGSWMGGYKDNLSAGIQFRKIIGYSSLKDFKEGQAAVINGDNTFEVQMLYTNPGHAKAMRVQQMVALPPPDDNFLKQVSNLTKLRDRMVSKTWTAAKADVAAEETPEIEHLQEGFLMSLNKDLAMEMSGCMAVTHTHVKLNDIDVDKIGTKSKSPDKKKEEKIPETVVPAGSDNDDGTQSKSGPKWSELLGQDEEADDEEEGKKSGSGDARKMKKKRNEEYDTEEAVESFAKDDEYTIPEGLNDDVMNILMGAADDIRKGLYTSPEIQEQVEKKSGMPSRKFIKPKGR